MSIRIPALSAAALAVFLTVPVASVMAQGRDEPFERGVVAYEDGNYEAAAELWAPLAERGNPEAMRNLAQLYRLGLGVEKDNERAFALYNGAAEKNSVEAQVNTAFLLLTGEGTPKNPPQAAIWFAKAADQGDALAQFNLGLMYEKGVGVEQDMVTARELYQLAANQGQRRALARLDALEAELPPDGGESARRRQSEARKAADDASLKQQDADLKAMREREREKVEREKAEEEKKAEIEAATTPLLKIERVGQSGKKGKASDEEGEENLTKLPSPPDAGPKTMTASKTPKSKPAPRRTAPQRAPKSAQSLVVEQVRQAEAAYKAGDYRTSARLFIPLARAGKPVALFWMGRMFNRGEGVALNRLEAYSLWRTAAEGGSSRAATALANLSNRLTPEQIAQAEAYHRGKFN